MNRYHYAPVTLETYDEARMIDARDARELARMDEPLPMTMPAPVVSLSRIDLALAFHTRRNPKADVRMATKVARLRRTVNMRTLRG